MPSATTWMDLEMSTLRQAEKDKYHMVSLMWNLVKRKKIT